MKWWLCISTATDDLKVYTYCYGEYPRPDEHGWYYAFSDDGESILVNKRFVTFMYAEKEADE